VDTKRFAEELPAAFVGDVIEGVVTDRRLHDIVASVPGYTIAAELAALNLAARLLPEGEAYLEVGTFKGRSIAAALLDAPDREFVAIENFQEFGMLGADARTELLKNLEERTSGRRFRLVDGDCFAVMAHPAFIDRPVGVYFYDGAHTGLSHWLALAVVEPLLANEALVFVDDASWPMVRDTTLRYMSRHPGWEILLDLPAYEQDDERWANGLLVLAYRRVGDRQGLAPSDEARRRFQVRLRGPLTSVVWRALHRWPRLVPVAMAIVPKRSRQVPPN
jgi:predicted O-methyltransferase YrrM